MSSKLPLLPKSPDLKAKGRFPNWLHRPFPEGDILASTEETLKKYRLNTVCEEAKCPNRLECFSNHTATFLALGKECTRACGFCAIDFSKTPKPPEADEPLRIALSTKELGLEHVVITMVARDDLSDGGASHLVAIMRAIRKENVDTSIELLTSDFAGNFSALDLVLDEKPEVFNYNIETVERLSPRVRHKATYGRTLEILSHAKKSTKPTFIKSGLMLGLGEEKEEILQTLEDLYKAGVDILTLGQYLQASRTKLLVKSFITPETFKEYEESAYAIGFKRVYAGPFVRSSYHAGSLKNLCLTESA
jgi:lipoic acid synthetase